MWGPPTTFDSQPGRAVYSGWRPGFACNYADDKMTVPAEDQVVLPDGKVLSELGDINSNLMLTKFNANAQPYYVILDGTGKPLVQPMGYNLDVKVFTKFLQDGIKAFGK